AFPGTRLYAGDVPHEIQTAQEGDPFYSPQGFWASHSGWFNPAAGGQVGLRQNPLGLYFEEIAYPFASNQILSWMPMGGSWTFLDFPAQAWWGREAAPGALQIL